jgi:hypothetical protein
MKICENKLKEQICVKHSFINNILWFLPSPPVVNLETFTLLKTFSLKDDWK